MRRGCYGRVAWAFLLGLVTVLAGGPAAAQATTVPTIRISTENTPEHVQARVLALFAARLEARLEGRVRVEVHDTAALYRGRDVIDGVAAGRVDMAAPGMWHLDRYVPDFGVFQLPMFYGRGNDVNYAVRDGAVGQELNARLAEAGRVTVLGRWIDLGEAHVFTAGANLKNPDDFKGLRIRVAGGKGNAARIRALGADAVVIPWPDFPAALAGELVDGTLTSAGTVISANLWERGIDHAYLDRQYFAQYVPIVSPRLWQRLPDAVRTAMLETWDGVVDEARVMAVGDQEAAVGVLKDHGVTMVRPSEAVLSATRARLMEHQPAIVRDLGLDPALVDTVRQALDEQ